MLSVKAKLSEAEDVKKFLIENNLFNRNYKSKKDAKYIYFPISKKIKDYEIVDINMKKIETQNAKNILLNLLTKKEQEKLKTAFDVIGDIAIIEIDDELKQKEKLIAEAILKTHKNINTVVKKEGIHSGTFRTQKTIHLAGEKKKETIHKENNIRLKLNVDEVYFSPRLATERKRIMQQIKKGENILVMFSGCAPYPVVFAKNTEAKHITGIEINPLGHKYGLENVKLNKLDNINLINGDVNKIVPTLDEKYDRILMPLPKSAEDFLDTALSVAKKGTIIHFYDFLHKDKFKEADEKIKRACERNNLNFGILNTTKCGQHAPYTFRICVDFKIK